MEKIFDEFRKKLDTLKKNLEFLEKNINKIFYIYYFINF